MGKKMSCEKIHTCPKCKSSNIITFLGFLGYKKVWCNDCSKYFEYRGIKIIGEHPFLYRNDNGNIRKCPTHKLPLDYAEMLDDNDKLLYGVLCCPITECDYEEKFNET